MNSLKEFKALDLASFMGGNLITGTPSMINIYVYEWGRITIHENGGEANVCFEYLRGAEVEKMPKGVLIDRYRLDFSVPYTGCDEAEFAARLLFYLRKAAHGVDMIDYFLQPNKEPESALQPCFTPTLIQGLRKLKCKCNRWLSEDSKLCIYLTEGFEFEVWYDDKTLRGSYKTFLGALKGAGVTL